MADKQVQTYQHINPKDKEKLRQSLLSLLDMVRVKIDEGKVSSLAFIIIGPDPEESGAEAYTGCRYLVHPTHIDLVDDVYQQMLNFFAKTYGVTPELLRQDRAKGAK